MFAAKSGSIISVITNHVRDGNSRIVIISSSIIIISILIVTIIPFINNITPPASHDMTPPRSAEVKALRSSRRCGAWIASIEVCVYRHIYPLHVQDMGSFVSLISFLIPFYFEKPYIIFFLILCI